MSIELDVIRHVARLARLELTDAELERYRVQVGAILEYIDQLKELGDLSRVEPFIYPAESANVTRPDQARPSPSKEDALKNGPDRTADYFVVPRVIEE
jgi:aspartyl-tRNA(Asn)/glutamyl-tRNA(Gln) amidotransferase subunit C